MRFARIVFVTAGIWGIAVLTPLYWLVDITGRRYGPPCDYPHFFYGFLGVALAWQLAFLMIGVSPARFRALMVPGTSEKFGYVATTVALYAHGRIAWVDAQAAVPAARGLVRRGVSEDTRRLTDDAQRRGVEYRNACAD